MAQISPPPCWSGFTFEEPFGDWCGNQTVTRLRLCGAEGCARLPPFPRLRRCPQPSGRRYNEELHAYTPPHFNCKRCTHPALWAGDGCIMGHARNMTIHHVRATCRLAFHRRPPLFVSRCHLFAAPKTEAAPSRRVLLGNGREPGVPHRPRPAGDPRIHVWG